MRVTLTNITGQNFLHDSNKICVNLRILMRYDMWVFLLIGLKKKRKEGEKKRKTKRTATQLCAKLASNLCETISSFRILLLTNTRTCKKLRLPFQLRIGCWETKNLSGVSHWVILTLYLKATRHLSPEFLLSFLTRTFKVRALIFLIDITQKNGMFSLFETSVKETMTFAYNMTFHFHSVFWREHWPVQMCAWF